MRWFALALWLTLGPGLAHAFCGFYVGSAESTLVNSATQVVMMREGDTTVLSMQNDYSGPPRDFALVVPVPVVLQQADVKTLPPSVFKRVDRLAAPRLVEYWEQDPCARPSFGIGGMGVGGGGLGGIGYGRGSGGIKRPAVRVEAQFAVGEYDIVVLSADDSAALETWLRQHKYAIPTGADAALRPYVARGMKFFVAKVNPKKVTFKDGRAVLSPLRVAYPSTDLRLPVRLGLLNSGGTQDLIVHILARDTRYEAANYPNVTIPTNLDVTPEARARFPEFYAALFDKTLAKTPGAVVTEYAWQSGKCDPCPGPVLSTTDLMTLGADVALGSGSGAVGLGVRLHALKPAVKGGLPPEVVQRILRRHQRAFQFCVDTAPGQLSASTANSIEVEVLIGPDGTVKTTRSLEGAGLAPKAKRCLEARMRRVRFPAPKSAGLTQVSAKWALRPARRNQFGGPLSRFVLTRLHYRYDEAALGEDLVFAPASAIAGGREVRVQPAPKKAPPPAPKSESKSKAISDLVANGKLGPTFSVDALGAIGGVALGFTRQTGVLETGARPAARNTFQARYAIRHPWTGPIACKAPQRGIWGANPKRSSKARSAAGMTPVKRGAITLSAWVPAGIPELDVRPKK